MSKQDSFLAMDHLSVLGEEIQEFAPQKIDTFLDLTFGLGGHSRLLLNAFPEARCIGVDQDPKMPELGMQKLDAELKSRIRLLHLNFLHAAEQIHAEGEKVDYIIMDLGINSAQLDDPSRGFSFSKDGPLDMRMDKTQKLTAEHIVNEYEEKHLRQIFFEWGEEKRSVKIAKRIVSERKNQRIHTTGLLRELIEKVTPPQERQKRIHCATRVFQALRIAVNKELTVLPDTLKILPNLINPGGKLAVISFHSLEDRPVKKQFKFWSIDCICPPEIPVCRCTHRKLGKILTTKPIRAKEQETISNPRARSAKLRVFEFNT